MFFAFFYTAIVFNPKDTADQLKKHSGFIPGIRPGERTAEYIDYILTRITVIGALYTGAALGNAAGPWFAGRVFDANGSYAMVIAGCAVVGLAIHLLR